MSRKRTRNLYWTPVYGPAIVPAISATGVFDLVAGGLMDEVLHVEAVAVRLADADEPDRPHVLILSVDDAEFLGNQLVSLARIARTRAAEHALVPGDSDA